MKGQWLISLEFRDSVYNTLYFIRFEYFNIPQILKLAVHCCSYQRTLIKHNKGMLKKVTLKIVFCNY